MEFFFNEDFHVLDENKILAVGIKLNLYAIIFSMEIFIFLIKIIFLQ